MAHLNADSPFAFVVAMEAPFGLYNERGFADDLAYVCEAITTHGLIVAQMIYAGTPDGTTNLYEVVADCETCQIFNPLQDEVFESIDELAATLRVVARTIAKYRRVVVPIHVEFPEAHPRVVPTVTNPHWLALSGLQNRARMRNRIIREYKHLRDNVGWHKDFTPEPAP